MVDQGKESPAPPEIGPYVFSVVLAAMGAWCFNDGWISSDPDMQEHIMFNRFGSVIMLSWAFVDFVRTWRAEMEHKSDCLENIEKQDDN
jgi:hypothetical protein